MAHKVGNGAIIGIASEDGIAARKRIALVDRTNMQIVGHTTSDEFGAYTFNGLDPSSSDYLVFAVDDNGDPKKAALIFDYVKPIPAHQGGFFWSNWYYIAMQKEPMAMALALNNKTNSSGIEFPFGVMRSHSKTTSTNTLLGQQTITMGAANLPSVSLIDGFMPRYALDQKNVLQDGLKASASCEWVINTEDQTKDVFLSLVSSERSINTIATQIIAPILSIKYFASQKSVRVYIGDGGTGPTANSAVKVSSAYILPTELQGKTLHIACSVTYNESVTLYINGALVLQESIVSAVKPYYSSSLTKYLYAFLGSSDARVSGDPSSSDQSDFTMAMYSFYSEAMSESEAMSHYQALFVDTLPLATGYKRAVMEDYPSHYFRLNDATESAIALDDLRLQAKNSTSFLKKMASSSIVNDPSDALVRGGGGMSFSGLNGALYNDYFTVLPVSNKFITIEFVAKPAADVTFMALLSSAVSTGGTGISFEVSASNNIWRLRWLELGAAVIVDLSTLIDTANKHHYAFVLDKDNQNIKLYVDSVLVETKPITSVLFTTNNYSLTNKTSFSIGGRVYGVANKSEWPYSGYLSEVAIYPTALSSSQIKSHYDSRLLI